MLTRCPHCQTHFRVTPEQLKARQGQVRCGACQRVFDALDSLSDEVATQPASQPPAPVHAAAAADGPHNPPEPSEPPESPEPLSAPEPATGEEAAVTSQNMSAATSTETAAAGDGEAPLPQDLPATEAMPAESATGAATASSAESRRSEDGAAAPDPQEEPPEATEDEAPPEDWESVPETPPVRRWPWAAGSVILILLAVLQLAFIFRIELAVLAPGLRPALAAGSELFGGTLPYPRKPELIGIEASDLAPAGADRLLLTATLKNRAPFDQEYPHLELALTDTQDAALVRKVLAPADYLPADRPARAGFASHAELALRLAIEAPGIPAVGYRLYLFYP